MPKVLLLLLYIIFLFSKQACHFLNHGNWGGSVDLNSQQLRMHDMLRTQLRVIWKGTTLH